MASEYIVNLYAYHHEMRDAGSVLWLQRWKVFAVARYEQVQAVLNDLQSVLESDTSPGTERERAIRRMMSRIGFQQKARRAPGAAMTKVEATVAHTEDNFGRVDILVNNVGLFSALKMQRYHEIRIEEWDASWR